jgi:four helix bundle protein
MKDNTGDEKGAFRFQKLEIWKKAIEIGNKLLDVADILEKRKLYRFSEQIRGASLSISNNIAEGSGSSSKKDFAHFLNIARRSAFENANMVIVFKERGLLGKNEQKELLQDLDEVCRMITGFIRNLKGN